LANDSKPITVPLQRGGIMSAKSTPEWFLTGTEYPRRAATFGLLINGENAFRAVHQAIEAAQKTVCIICWGFQPSMYFIRDGKSPSIGALLEKKAREGIKVRVLCWSQEISTDLTTLNLVGMTSEPNTSGRRDLPIEDKLPGMSDVQFEYNRQWFGLYDAQTDHGVKRKIRSIYRGITNDTSIQNLVFRSRGFSPPDRAFIATKSYLDKSISKTTRTVLAGAATHHQKMVLIDHESAEQAIGFVMGHNMLDLYWDTNAHSTKGRPSAANLGANAPFPREDFSSRITGPILEDLYDNFQAAWNKALEDDRGHAEADPLPIRSGVEYKQKPRGDDVPMMAQIVRTQSQLGKFHIKETYLQKVKNATQLIYMENQYFRWPPLAERIREHAQKMSLWGRTPEEHGKLYLFVITNTSDEGMGDGAYNTQRMLETVGHGAALPAATRDARIERGELPQSQKEQYQARQAKVNAAQADIKQAEAERSGIDSDMRFLQGSSSEAITNRYAPVVERLNAAQQRKADAQKELDDWTTKTITASEVQTPGLKTLVCRLVAPDTPKGTPWVETYIHAKLTIIDDTFMTLGSANLNTRSMESDSELNILHDRPEVSRPARETLWDMHTRNYGGERIADLPLDDAYKAWEKIMAANLKQRKQLLTPIAPLDAFLRLDPSRKDWD
jgi:phosphatidylserine/phosphatidylglycerophosphate/cardiolipin synthase-like enzyme